MTLNQPIAAASTVPAHTNITFTPSVTPAAAASGLPLLQAPSTDWLASCLSHYGAFTFGSGFNLANASSLRIIVSS